MMTTSMQSQSHFIVTMIDTIYSESEFTITYIYIYTVIISIMNV